MNKTNIHPGITFGIAIACYIVHAVTRGSVVSDFAEMAGFLFLALGVVGSIEQGIREKKD